MAQDRIDLFAALDEDLEWYNGKALLNFPISFYYPDSDNPSQIGAVYDFPGYVSSYWKIFNRRQGKTLKSFTTQVTRSSNVLLLNCSVSDMTFEDNIQTAKYYYEMGYIQTGGYEIPLRYGDFYVK